MRKGLGHAGEDIAHSPDGANQLAATLQLFAQVANVDIEKAIVGRGLALEEGGGDFIAGDDAARGANEHLKEIELHGGKFDGGVGAPHFAGSGIYADVADGHGGRFGAYGGLSATQD